MPVASGVSRDSRIIFSCADRSFTARDIIDAAFVRGELHGSWTDFLRVLECDRIGADQEIDEAAVDSASVAFRYEHDLITAEETERWLEDRGLTLSDFSAFFARHYLARVCSGPIDPARKTYAAADAEEKDLFVVDLILSDRLDRLADNLAFRIAALTDEQAKGRSVNSAEERSEFLARSNMDRHDLDDWFSQIGRDLSWLDEMVAAEAAFRGVTESLLTQEALGRELTSMRLNLTRFELETIEVDSRDAAAEVVACVRNDGMEMAEVAQESRYPFHRSEVLLEDIPSEQQQRFLSVRAGALFDPIPREDAFEVWRVKTRSEPSLQDAAIRERLERRIVNRHFSELVSKYIDWALFPQSVE